MGVVYLASDPRLQRRVALKTIHVPQGLERSEIDAFRERFLREAQAAGGISHPGIVTIYGVDECPEEILPFITMEYVAGRNLRQILQEEKQLDPKRAFRIADALADALHTAHTAGVIHRDIKPANVLVRESDGAVKIADFGVAQLSMNALTRVGEMAGSPAYMAPEQIRSSETGARSDLFSLGVILYEMLAGQRPFGGDDMPAIIHHVVYQDAVPITQVVPGLPGIINAFFDRALAKSPRDRFQSGAQFREALNDVQLEYEIDNSGGMAFSERTLAEEASPFTEVTPEGEHAESPYSLRQYLVFGALFAIFLLGWILLRNPSDPPPAPAPAEPSATAAGTRASPSVTAEPALEAEADAALGETILVPLDEIADLVGAPAEPVPAPPRAPAKRKAAPPTPKPVPLKAAPVTEVATTPEPSAGDGGAGADAARNAPAEVAAVLPEPARLTLITKSSIKEGTLTLFVDGEEELTLDLTSDGMALTRFYRKALSRGEVSEAGVLELPPGAHEIVVRVTRPGKDREREATLQVDLAEGEARNLVIVAGRLFGSGLVLKLD